MVAHGASSRFDKMILLKCPTFCFFSDEQTIWMRRCQGPRKYSHPSRKNCRKVRQIWMRSQERRWDRFLLHSLIHRCFILVALPSQVSCVAYHNDMSYDSRNNLKITVFVPRTPCEWKWACSKRVPRVQNESWRPILRPSLIKRYVVKLVFHSRFRH